MMFNFFRIFPRLFRYISYLVVFLIVSIFVIFCFVRFFEKKDKSCFDYEGALGLPERCIGEFKRDAEGGSFDASYMLFLISLQDGDDQQARFWMDRMFHLKPDAALSFALSYCGDGHLFSEGELLILWHKMPKEKKDLFAESRVRNFCR